MKTLLRIIPFVLLVLAAACSSPAKTPQGPVTVTVSAGDFTIDSSLTTFKVGVPYHFVVTNTGKVDHEVMIVKPAPAGTSMEALDSEALLNFEMEELKPGVTLEKDYTFTQAYPAGTLEFACHVPGHYEAGMKEAIVVEQ